MRGRIVFSQARHSLFCAEGVNVRVIGVEEGEDVVTLKGSVMESINDTCTQQKCHKVWYCILKHLPMFAVIAALAMVIWWSHGYFSQLIANLKDSRSQMRYQTPTPSYACFEKTGDNSEEICKAYEALDQELTAWLSVLTIAGGIFGLIAPLIGYLLQHHKLKDEREDFDKVISDFKTEQREKYREIKQDLKTINGILVDLKNFKFQCAEDVRRIRKIASDNQAQSELFSIQTRDQLGKWMQQIIAFAEYSLLDKLTQAAKASTKDIANLIIAFDYLLESLIAWREEGGVEVLAKIQQWIKVLDAFWQQVPQDLRSDVYELLRKQFRPSDDFASRKDFVKILRADSDEFKWLEDFFKPFAPWKFG